MTITSPHKFRERILVVGGAGVGKSHAALCVAKKIATTMHVIDNDNAWDRQIETDPARPDNIVVNLASNWSDHLDTVGDIVKNAHPDDWMVIDILSPTWMLVQEWFTEQIYGQGLADYLLMARKALREGAKALQPFEGFVDWSVINPQYRRLQQLILHAPCHVFCTAEVDPIQGNEDQSIQRLFGPYGLKPRGQKRTAHIFQTVLLFTKRRVGEYEFTTIKDRGREDVADAGLSDFAVSYLMRVGGWTAVKPDPGP